MILFKKKNLLFDLGFSGPDFTCCNGQNGLARHWARLYRFLANSAWVFKFYSYFNKHLPQISSDHAPIFFTAKFFSHRKSKIFWFDNFLFEHEGCHKVVSKAWNFNPHSSSMHSMSHLISRTKTFLLSWRTSWLTPLEMDIKNTESDITSLEASEVSSHHFSSQSQVLMRLKNGDFNTTFFHTHARIRNHTNKISAMLGDDGSMHSNQHDITNCFTSFYSKLWDSSKNLSVSDLVKAFPNDLP